MSSQPMQSSQISCLALLVEWANRQDQWIRQLTMDVIATRRRLSDENIGTLYELLLREKKLVTGDPIDVKRLSPSQIPFPTAEPLKLASLTHIDNVNALAPDQEITFHPRLTVCFGENATGKTGYVRILKRMAAVRPAEPVLPNIRGVGYGRTQRVRIKAVVGNEEHVFDWEGEQGIEPLTRVDVFDTRAVVVHLSSDLDYSYTPADLSLFPLVSDGLERVQARLQDAKTHRQPLTNPFANRFDPESEVHALIEDLDASTDLRELEARAQVSNQEKATLPGLRERVVALRSDSVAAQIEALNREAGVLTEVLSVLQIVEGFDREAYDDAIAGLRTAQANHERATRDALASEDVPGILDDAWNEFVEAAEDYIRANGLDPYPASDARCIYCRQVLDVAAVALVQKYRDYCNATLRRAVEQAREHVRTLSQGVRALRLHETQRAIDQHVRALADPSDIPPAVLGALDIIEHAKVLHQAITEERDCPLTPGDFDDVTTALRTAIETGQVTKTSFRKQGEERAQALAEESTRLLEIEARLTLSDLLPAIREHVLAIQWSRRASAYLGSFQGIKRSLTDTAKRASEEVINRRFQERFREECQDLRAPKVTLDFPGREGRSRRRKLLTPDHSLGEILSEGEQKVLALADFLAEVSLRPDTAPIVLDDPVTSLDHKRLQHVVDRVVELSCQRQIIVFTHDIWFAAELLARFERDPDECAFYDVTAEGERIGLIARGAHPRTDTFNDRRRNINKQIEQAEMETGEKRQGFIEKGYEELRGACEIVVEKDLLKGVTERYRPNVRMAVLEQIRADRLPLAVNKIVPIFDRCCRYIASHSQPLATLGVRPTLQELKDDWTALQEARREYMQH